MEDRIVPFEKEELTPVMMLNEYIMTSLRTSQGCFLPTVTERFGADKSNTLQELSTGFIEKGWMQLQHHSLILTREGRLFADGIASDLFF
jgi:oxygen-independent coproporphyrinogen-3 oxidase